MFKSSSSGDSSGSSGALEGIHVELKQNREQPESVLRSVNFCSAKITDFENEINRLNEYDKNTELLRDENQS